MKKIDDDFIILSSLFISIIIISNIIAGKLINIGPFVLTLSILIYPLSFTIANIINEIYGAKTSKKIIKAGFISSALLVLISLITVYSSPSPIFKFNEAYKIVFGAAPRIIFASFLSYFASQNANIWIFDSLKSYFKDKNLFFRNIISMIFTQLIDSIIFVLISFFGLYELQILINMVFSQYLVKLLISILNSPLISITVKMLRKRLVFEN
jgi:hypothetical protein